MSDHDLSGWQFAHIDTAEWRQTPDGTPFKLIGEADGVVFVYSEMPPGGKGAPHPHRGLEFVFLLDGDLSSNGVEMTPGAGYVAAAGSEHTEFSSRQGARFISALRID